MTRSYRWIDVGRLPWRGMWTLIVIIWALVAWMLLTWDARGAS